MTEEVKQRGKPIVNEVVQAFTDFIGLEPTPRLRQRQYANTLHKMLGDKTMDVVTYAIKIQDDYYAPVVTSPKDLYYKVDKVMAYYRKNNGEGDRVLKV